MDFLYKIKVEISYSFLLYTHTSVGSVSAGLDGVVPHKRHMCSWTIAHKVFTRQTGGVFIAVPTGLVVAIWLSTA